MQHHLGGLQGAAQDMVEWSANMSGALTAQQQDIETYLTEERKRDIPPGESGLVVVFVVVLRCHYNCYLLTAFVCTSGFISKFSYALFLFNSLHIPSVYYRCTKEYGICVNKYTACNHI